MKGVSRVVSNDRGQSIVEFALIAPVVLLVMFGIVSFGLIFTWKNQLNNAAREGARAGAVCKSYDEIIQVVTNNLTIIPHPETVAVTVTPRDDREKGAPITVELRYTADVVPIPGILTAQRVLVGRSTFRMECNSPAP
jgi:Flp pilus assembly protein TadG